MKDYEQVISVTRHEVREPLLKASEVFLQTQAQRLGEPPRIRYFRLSAAEIARFNESGIAHACIHLPNIDSPYLPYLAIIDLDSLRSIFTMGDPYKPKSAWGKPAPGDLNLVIASGKQRPSHRAIPLDDPNVQNRGPLEGIGIEVRFDQPKHTIPYTVSMKPLYTPAGI